MAKDITFDISARDGIKRGVDALANAVKVTLGPKGRNVIISKSFGGPQVTKDGVSVAKEIELQDALENMGAQMVKEVASKTNDFAQAGDFYRTLSKQQQENLIKNLSGDLGAVTDKNIQKTMIGHFYQADRNFGMALAKALGFSQKDFMH